MVDQHEPEPIPESITYDGQNLQELLVWARSTLSHYELPNYDVVGYNDGELAKVFLQGQSTWLQPGDQVTYDERQDFVKVPVAVEPWTRYNRDTGQIETVPVRQQFVPEPGPEILARDHPQTVTEAAHLHAGQDAYGVPRSQETFVQRRAAVPGAELAASMSRHPSSRSRTLPGVAGSAMSISEQAAALPPPGRSVFGPRR